MRRLVLSLLCVVLAESGFGQEHNLRVETMPDGSVVLRADGYVAQQGSLEQINGCAIDFTHFVEIPMACSATFACQSPDLRIFLRTGTNSVRVGTEFIDVAIDRTVTFSEPRIVTATGGGRTVEIDYSMPLLTNDVIFHWWFRKPDGTLVLSSNRSALSISRNRSATARITVPSGMTGGGTLTFTASVGGQLLPCPHETYTIVTTVPPLTAESPFELRMSIFPDAPTGFTASKRVTPAMTVRVALGTIFDVGVVKKQGFLDPVLPLKASFASGSSAITPETTEPTVYKNDVVRPFALTTTPAETQRLVAVHYGSAMLHIVPLVPELAPITLTIRVVEPVRLGDVMKRQPDGFDKSVALLAHHRGIPPQYLKGQVAQESPDANSVRWDNFRYEPCSWDLQSISKGELLIEKVPYSGFKLDDAVGTTLHRGVMDDLDPRNRYSIPDGVDPKTGKVKYRRLTDNDANVTARTIWESNDAINAKMNWSKFKCGSKKKDLQDAIKKDISLLDFVAQTPTASSYGLFQLMYGRALEEGWKGVVLDPAKPDERDRSPKYLFDRPEYVMIGGGTMTIGSSIDADNFQKGLDGRKVCYKVWKYPVPFTDVEQYEEALAKAFQGYNCGHTDDANKPIYGPGVIAKSRRFLPVQPSLIFE